MFCSSCGAKIDDNSRFCAICGAVLAAGAQNPMQQGMPMVNNRPMQPGNGMPIMNPVQPMPPMQNAGRVNGAAGKKSKAPFIILGAAVIVVIIGIVVISAIIREKRMADSYYDFYTKDEFNQMIQEEYGNEENNRTKGIGEKTVEDVINSYYGDGNEDDEELQEKLKNSSSPWFKDPGDQ